MRILFLGDIVGQIGINAVSEVLPKLVDALSVDFVIANGENASRGKGLSYRDYRSLVSLGIGAITLGNHWHSKDQIDDYINRADCLIRPANLLSYYKGVGTAIYDCNGIDVQVTNLLGQAFMDEEVESPYEVLEGILAEESCPIHIVDFHGESTSEKSLFAHYFDGQVSAVLGTHTHIQTNDCRILPSGTAFQSDAGFSGDHESIIGFEPNSVINKLLKNQPGRFEVREENIKEVNATLLVIDELSGKALEIVPIRIVDGKEVNYGPHGI